LGSNGVLCTSGLAIFKQTVVNSTFVIFFFFAKVKRFQMPQLWEYSGVAPLLIAAPGFLLQLRLAAKAGQSGVSASIPNARANSNLLRISNYRHSNSAIYNIAHFYIAC
jgi:hypothetical protein